MDLKHKRPIDSQAGEAKEITENSSSPLASSNETKCCSYCKTTSTPLWRGGPAGPKSLCNACGIKYNKRKRAQVSVIDKTRRKSKNANRSGESLKVRLMVADEKLQQQQIKRKRSSYERGKPWWNKLREEEQAAILLMAISCGGCF